MPLRTSLTPSFRSPRKRRSSNGHSAFAIAVVALLAGSVLLGSCRRSRNLQKPDVTKGQHDTAQVDTSQSELSKQFDSLSNKVSGFFKSLLPPGEDTTKGGPVLTPPPPPVENPTAQVGETDEKGFLKNPVREQVEFDSNGNVTLRHILFGADVDQPMTMSLSEYLRQREEENLDQAFRDALHKQLDTGKTVESTTGLLGDYSQIQIPIPPSIVPTIFGRPSINLRVNGDVAIHLAYRDHQTYAAPGVGYFGSETGLDFKQEINVSTNGTIGDKLKIGADWGSDRMFQFDNLLKLGYTGYPDEILQSFEAGNVDLKTPSKYIGVQEALFGLKAITRFGPMYFTALAAQKKAERQTRSFGNGPAGPAIEHIIKPYEYRKNSFFLDTSFRKNYEPYYSTPTPNSNNVTGRGYDYLVSNASRDVQVWISTKNTSDPNRRYAIAYYSLPAASGSGTYPAIYRRNPSQLSPVPRPDSIFVGYFTKLDTNRYRVDQYTGVLTLNQEPGNEQVVAVSYRTSGPQGSRQFGELDVVLDTPLVLKMIKPERLFVDPSLIGWNNLLKNSYYVGGANFDEKDFAVRIVNIQPTGQQKESMRVNDKAQAAISVLGLDRVNNNNPADFNPDRQVDFGGTIQNSAIVDKKTGTLTFPYLEPFGEFQQRLWRAQRQSAKNDSTFYMPEIYHKIQDELRRSILKQVTINVKFSGGLSSTLNLQAFNLVEGSVRVTAASRQLTENVDYRVDYNSGTVTILNPDLLSTGNINVEYDVHDIFTNATKNLLGFRADLPIPDHGGLGMSLMNYSMHLPTLKTRQGEEPLSNWIWGIDGTYTVDAPILTDALNALPFFNLKDKSQLIVKADAALSLPNPNTQSSPMSVDDGASIAYLDDFEGGKNTFQLYTSYFRWKPSSIPIDTDYQRRFPGSIYDTNVNRLKGWGFWYEPYPMPAVRERLPNKQTPHYNDPDQIIDFVFDPKKPGIYNPYPLGGPGISETDKWGGMMQYSAGLNVIATNTDAIELWIKVPEITDADRANAILRFDLGRMSEDVIPNHVRDYEDKNNNGKYDPGEDLGLDNMNDDQERDSLKGAWNADDPNNDNYFYQLESTDYTRVNGQQGNEGAGREGLSPDDEDLDGNGSVNLDDSYYEYEIPLDLKADRNRYVIGNTGGVWYQLRIPLADYKRIVGTQDSSFSNISYYRFWIKGVSQPVRLQLADMMLVGSQWTRSEVGLDPTNPIRDTSLRISYINIEENSAAPTNYHPPDGAERDRLPGQTTYILGNEQSIDMKLTNVADTESREAMRVFPSPNDIFNYRSMAIWVHGDEDALPKSFADAGDTNSKVWVYLRWGTDNYNYYEYRRPLLGGWQNIHVDFATLTALKAARPPNVFDLRVAAKDGVPGSTYRVVGSPTLTNAAVFTLGVNNRTGTKLTTDVWWDELRLLDANDKADYAYNASAQVKLAEFGSITTTMVNERPDFHRVDERFNQSRALNLSWNATGEFRMEKLLPKWMEDKQTKLGLTVSHTESVFRPKFITNTDIDLDATIAQLQAQMSSGAIDRVDGQHAIDSLLLNNETLDVKNSIGASDIQLRFPGSFFLIPAFVNRLNFGLGYAEDYARTPTYEYNRAWSWTATGRYSLPPLPNWSVSPFSWWGSSIPLIGTYSGWKIQPFPTNVNFALSTTRGRTHSLTRLSTLSFTEGDYQDTLDILNSWVPVVNRVFTATRGLNFDWKPFEGGFLSPAFNYALDVSSNLVPLETRTEQNREGNLYDSIYYYQRAFSDIMSDVFFKNGQLARLGNDFKASQRIRMATSPRLPNFFGLEKLARPVFDYRVEYLWQDAQNLQQNAKQAAWNNTITTGLELNARELGVLIFGKPLAEEPQQGPGGRRVRGRDALGVTPEELPDRGIEERESPIPPARNETRNQVERGEDMRPQSRPNPLGRNKYITDTLQIGRPGPRVDTAGKIHIRGVGTAGERDQEYLVDTLLTPVAPPMAEAVPSEPEEPPVTVKEILQTLIQKPLFDWNGTRFNFTQTNQSVNGALQGDGSGITNFFGRFFSPEEDANGPSRAYQLGLITDPHGRLIIHTLPQFPFVGFDVRHGLRASNPFGKSVDITDAFIQTNNFELSTSRPLWSGASINLNWKLSFGYDERNTMRINEFGEDSSIALAKAGDVSRTFFSIPSLPFLKLGTGIEEVGKKYEEKVHAAGVGIVDSARTTLPADVHNRIERESFMEGFETLPMFSGMLREFLPRLNYSFNWSGLEKFFLFSWADRASFRHGYNGTYRRNFRQNPGDTLNLTSLQTIIYGFRPLIALDLGWDKFFGGRLTSSFNYDTQTEWAADYASTRISRRLSTTVGMTANYQRQGLKVPFFKLDLKNEFGASFTFSETISSDDYFNFWNITTNPQGIPNGGLTKTTIEPRISYTVSQQLTLEGFYRYERTTPAQSAVISPPTRTIQAGVDLRLKIQ